MGKKKKTMCEWDKSEIEEHLTDLIKIARKARYICSKCGRVAVSKKSLCKPYDMGALK
jgi:hypothetical protein